MGQSLAVPTRIIGRDREVVDIRGLLSHPEVRLLTLTGPPGVGKTRLALEVARDLPGFPDGILFVDLIPIQDASHVLSSIATSLGVRLVPNAPGETTTLAERVAESLDGRRILLLVDNFEHVIGAASEIAELLGAAPTPKILVTSRVPLRLRWEREFSITPLAVPDVVELRQPARLTQIPSVALFVERARAVKQDFSPTEHEVSALGQICRRLGGLPLAIELAASLVKAIPPLELLSQLRHQLDLLSSNKEDVPVRHRSLRAAIKWSYELPSFDERAMLDTVAVFSGGCTMEATQAVYSGEGTAHVALLLTRLVDASLLQAVAKVEGVRYSMLESVREFCLERLAGVETFKQMQQRHALYFMTLAEEARSQISGPDQLRWLDRLEEENENLRAAMQWSFASSEADVGLRIAAALVKFWTVRGLLKEGRGWLEQGLRDPHASNRTRGQALVGLGEVIWRSLEPCRVELFEEARSLATKTGDKRTLALALRGLAIGLAEEEKPDEARPLFEQSYKLLRECREEGDAARTIFQLGMWVMFRHGNYGEAQAQFLDSLSLSRSAGDRISAASGLHGLGVAAMFREDYDQACRIFEERLELLRELRYTDEIALTLDYLGTAEVWSGALPLARSHFEQMRILAQSIGSFGFVAEALDDLATVSELEGRYVEAAAHFAEALRIRCSRRIQTHTATTLRKSVGVLAALNHPMTAAQVLGATENLRAGRHPKAIASHERRVSQIRRVLSPERMEIGRAEGRRMSVDQAAEVTLAALIAEGGATKDGHRKVGRLSRREWEVTDLIAKGQSNRAIAARLFIGERTVETHVQHILNKFGFDSRTQIAAWAVEQRLSRSQAYPK